MHIDNKQLLELIAEAAGMELEVAEKQLTELVTEIKASLDEDEAYEIDGFGIFSSLGNRIMFIPSDELETEINFKYVGMEPIELDEPAPSFDDPFEGLDDDGPKKSKDARFAGLIDEDIKDPLLQPDEDPGPEMWGVEAHKEDESADRLFASLMGQDYEPPMEEEDGIDASESTTDDDFSDIFDDTGSEESSIDLGAEVAAFMESESDPVSEEPTTDDLLDDIFSDEYDVNELDAVIEGEKAEDEEVEESPFEFEEGPTEEDILEIEEPQEDEIDIDSSLEEPTAAPILEMESSNTDEPDDIFDELENSEGELEAEEPEDILDDIAEPEFENAEDFDDPFLNIEDEQIDESVLRMEEFDDTEIIPVIKNITTDAPDSGPEKAAEASEEKPKKEKKKKEKKKKEPKDSQPAPAWLWVVLLLIIVGGSVVGLGYFSIINIPFITPQTASNTVSPQQQTPAPTTAQPAETATPTPVDEVQTNVQETPSQEQAIQQAVQASQAQAVNNQTSASADQYGLSGSVSESGIDGYTIILYTLSNQQNAINERQKLLDAGYRGFLVPVANAQFGTLYRVCVGQFATLFDAAVAAEEIENLLPDNYIIKKIN